MLRFQPYHFETAEPRTVPDEWRDLFGRQEGTPPIRVWARTEDDRRVCIYMMDFAPYCYIDTQSTIEQDALITVLTEFNDEFRSVAAKSLFSRAGFKRGPGNGRDDEQQQQVNYIREVEIVRQQNAIYGYTRRTDQVFLKVTFVQPQLVATFRNWLWKHKTVKSGGYLFGPTVYEANVQYHQRFIVDTKMVPHCWAEVPLDKVVPTDKLYRGRCDLVLAIPYQEVTVCLFDSPKNNSLARYRLSFYDNEMISETGAFPVAQNNGDEIVVLAMSSYQLTETGMVPTRRTAFISGGTDVDEFTDGRSVVVTRSERDLLKAAYTHWAIDISDVISGYNIDQFDNSYTFERAARLGLKEFKFFGCASDERVTSKPNTFKSNAYGQTEDLDWDIPGVIDLDLLRYFRREKRNLRSYKLDDVAKQFAGDQKMPMDYRLIKPYYEGTPKQRYDLVDYCFHDEELCARLNDSQQIFVNLVGMARVTGVRICDLICSGQQIKVQSQLLQHVHNRYVVPTFERRNDKTVISGVNGRDKRQAVQPKRSDFGLPDEEGDNDELHSMDSDDLKLRIEAYMAACKVCAEQKQKEEQEEGDESKAELNIDAEEEGKYAGATVFEPKRGFYRVPIMTLDFSSLYPSIMIQHNLCIAEGTPVTLACGLTMPIEEFLEDGGDLVLGWQNGLFVPSKQVRKINSGIKQVLELTLLDGRTIKCTPDHRVGVLTLNGEFQWKEAQSIDRSSDRIVVGLDAPVTHIHDKQPIVHSGIPFFDNTFDASVFARLLGYIMGDGHLAIQKQNADLIRGSVAFGSQYDYQQFCCDLNHLGCNSPTLNKREAKSEFRNGSGLALTCRLPQHFLRMVQSLDGIVYGRRSEQAPKWPKFLLDEHCPLVVTREFLAGSFGADGWAPLLNNLSKQRAQLTGVCFSHHTDEKHVDSMVSFMECIATMLKRVGVTEQIVISVNKSMRGQQAAQYLEDNPSSRLHRSVEVRLTLNPGITFHTQVGFRYCAHKSQRLMAASAFWRYRDNILRQLNEIKTQVAAQYTGAWRTQLKILDKVLEGYPEPLLDSWIETTLRSYGRMGSLHNRSVGSLRYGAPNGPLDATEFLRAIDALHWFVDLDSTEHINKRTKKKVYSHDQDSLGLENMAMPLVARRMMATPVQVFDLTVDQTESFLANGVLVHNCYSTLLRNGAHLDMDPRDYTAAPNGSYFVKPHIREGMLPRILMNLLAERKKTRDEQKKIDKDADPFRYAVLEGRQLALKISANSVYGFTGATTGMLPCVEIASAVTAFGRQMLDYIKLRIETRYSRANGFEFDADVIYGDTDSCMIKFGPSSMAKCMELGRDAAEWINAHFQALGMDAKLRDDFLAEMKCDTYEEALLRFPKEAVAYAKKHGKSTINLLFEKGLYPMLLINKKRYIGGYYLEPDKMHHVHESGVESVRRDNCLLLAKTLKKCAKRLMRDVDPEAALQVAQQAIADLLQGQVPWEKLVISKGLSKKAEEYANQDVAQQLIVNKLRGRRGMPEYKSGDRVPYGKL